MINKTGLLGEGISAPVILFIVVVIMGLFGIIAAGEFKIVNPTGSVAGSNLDVKIPYSYSPLFDMLPVSIYDSQKQTRYNAFIRLIDIYSLPSSLQVDVDSLKKALVQLTTNTKSCLLFYSDAYPIKPTDPFASVNPRTGRVIKYSDGAVRVVEGDEAVKMFNYYYKNNLLHNTLFTSKINSNDYSFVYYYGSCLDG